MRHKIFFSVVLFLSATSFFATGFIATAWANEYSYQADVKGMVCAFCAYNVSKNVSSLPGVDADSVAVDLHGGQVAFSSSQRVNENRLISVFADSGFTVSNLQMSEVKKPVINHKDAQPALKLEFESAKAELYNSIIEAVGNIVASTTSRLLIVAPKADEEKLLKPLLMGRQQVINIRFIPEESKMIRIQLFTE